MTGAENQPADDNQADGSTDNAEADNKASDKSASSPEAKSAESNSDSSAKDTVLVPPEGENIWPEQSEKNEESSSEKPELTAAENSEASSITLTRAHVSHLLSDVLEDNAQDRVEIKGIRFPMVFDLLLGLGLLVAVGGFTIGLFHMYIIHSASQSISEQKYKKAITLLKGAPLPQIFARAGSDTEELLSKARYLDAIDKIESGTDINDAIKELGEIRPGSKYFALAQEAINENTEAAPVLLEGGTETTETAPQNPEQNQSLLDKTLKEEQH